MSGLRPLLLSGLIVLVLIVVIVVVALLILPETDFVRNEVRDGLQNATNQNVTLGGVKVSISFPNLINLSLEGISLTSKQGQSLLSAERVFLAPSLISLLRQEIAIKSMVIEGLRIFIRRTPDGTIEGVFPPLPVHDTGPVPENVAQQPREPDSNITHSGRGEARGDHQPSQIKWSVNTIKFVNGRVDWIDRKIVPGQETVVFINEFNGFINQEKSGDPFSFNFTGKMSNDKLSAGSLKVDGFVRPAPDLSGLEQAVVNLHLDSIQLKIVDPYASPWIPEADKFSIHVLDFQVNWEKGKPGQISVKTQVKANSPEIAQVNIKAEVVTAHDFSGIEQIRGTGETDVLPLRFFKTFIPPQIPLSPDKGTIKAEVLGTWTKVQNWKLQGALGLENASPSESFSALGNQVRVWLQVKLDPDTLVLDNLEISAPNKLVSLTGTISKPYSESPILDLRGEAVAHAQWIKNLGTQLPETLKVIGSIPLKGSLKGGLEDLRVDMVGDVTSLGIEWFPYLEKPQGTKGSLSVKGKFFYGRDPVKKVPAPEFFLHLGFSGISLGMRPKGQWLAGANLQFDSRLLLKINGSDLTDAVLSVGKGQNIGDILSAKGSISDLGSNHPRIDCNAILNFDHTLLSQSGFEVPSDTTIGGKASVKTRISGTAANMEWSVHLPLTHLDLSVGKFFRKSNGTTGDLSASGKWSDGELVLGKSNLILPGLVASGQGNVRDKNGSFSGLTLEVKKAELKEISKLVPAVASMGLSGLLEARFRVTQSGKGIVQTGTIRLLEVDYHPENSVVSLEKMKGSLEIDGNSLQIPQVTGSIKGTVDAPLKIKGKLNQVESVENLNGSLVLEIGQGTLKADLLKTLMNQAQTLIGTSVNSSVLSIGDLLEIQSGTASIQLESGTARTEDLKFKGPSLSLGAVGRLRLGSLDLDALAYIQTVVAVGNVLQRVPAVQKLIKQHEGLLKITGLDKELKRFGIEAPDAGSTKPGEPETVKTPVNVIVKLRGPITKPDVTPVLESALDKNTVSRLKSLVN